MSPSADVSTTFPVVAGVPLEVHWHGPGPAQAPTLVFLHDGLGSAGLRRGFPRDLAATMGCGAVVSSRAGYGHSGPATLPRPTTYLHHEGLVVLPERLAHYGVQDHVLIGHSDGGSMAVINAGGAPGAGLLGVVTEAAHVLHVFNEPLSHGPIQRAEAAYETTDFRARLARPHRDVDMAFRGWSDVWLSEEFWNWNLEAYLPRISVPLLAIQGEDDHYGSARQVEAIVSQAGGPAHALILPACAHTPHREAADATLAAMRDFRLPLVGRAGR